MDSITIPIPIIHKLNDIHRSKINNNDRNDLGYVFDEPLILFFQNPLKGSSSLSSSSSSSSSDMFQRTNNTTLSIYSSSDVNDNSNACLILENVIPAIPPSPNHRIDESDNDGTNTIISLHPLVEEFVIAWCDIIVRPPPTAAGFVHNEQGEMYKQDLHNSNIHTTNLNSAYGYLLYVHPPEYYMNPQLLYQDNDVGKYHGESSKNIQHSQQDDEKKSALMPQHFNNCDDDNDETIQYNESFLLQRKVSKRRVYIQRLTSNNNVLEIQKMLFASTKAATKNDEKQNNVISKALLSLFELKMELQFIYCTHKGYEEWFHSISSKLSPPPPREQKQIDMMKHENKSKDNPMHQYLYHVLCQQLEFKIIKKAMILPLKLPTFPSHYNQPNQPDTVKYEEEDDIVVFFKLQNFEWKLRQHAGNNGSNGNHHHHSTMNGTDLKAFVDIKNMEMNCNPNSCYKIGAICDYDSKNEDYFEDGGKEYQSSDDNSLYVDLQISSLLQQHLDGDGENSVLDESLMDSSAIKNKCTCPGYSKLVNEISSLAKIPFDSAAPTAVLLVGCAGVGKSRLASSIADELWHESSVVKSISAKDILLQASSTILDIDVLKSMILPPTKNHSLNNKQYILIIDDLDAVIDLDNEESSTHLFDERRATLHAILESIDDLVKQRKKMSDCIRGTSRSSISIKEYSNLSFIFGICCAEQGHIPSSLHRVGRFEKIIEMAPPTEMQRHEMLAYLLHQLPLEPQATNHSTSDEEDIKLSKEHQIDVWSKALARTTPGCVACDLKKICMDAVTKSSSRIKKDVVDKDCNELPHPVVDQGVVTWEDLSEATRSCIPSQLAHLDVTIPRDNNLSSSLSSNQFVDTNDIRGTKAKFDQSWSSFSGYLTVKADVYRTVYRPWCRRHHSHEDDVQMSKLEMEVPPPSGILFHGPSGNGKTHAVDCLALSLGLNMVKIRASDILDKWLGGSEAAIRSIFARSRSASPCLLLFDELDAIATNREDNDSGCGSGTDVYSRLLSTLLNEMDGVNNNSKSSNNALLVVGTTNRIHAIDPALLRPGRFEKHIHLQNPSVEDVKLIMNKYLSKVPLGDDVDINDLSEVMEELDASGADVQGVCRESCLIAMRKISDGTCDTGTDIEDVCVCNNDFEEAIQMWKKG